MECKRIKNSFYIIAVIFLLTHFVHAVELLENGKVIIPDEAAESIKINGVLNENIWGLPPISGEFKTFFPVFGETMDQKTMIWMAYDNQNLYFAFKCLDNEPNKIKTSISRRDTVASSDDSIGVVIDVMGNRQTSYEFYVNPDGIQEDGLTSAVNGWSYDTAPDFVWESAGKIVDDGYQVELCIPLESIRFKSGKEVKMGIMFARNISRLGKAGSWPGIDAFQVLVNQRYPVFYTEKRPFFMEGMDVLDFGLISQGMMVSAVHTRRIIDPAWAAKLSGTSGKMAFNLLVSNDNAPGLAWEGEVNPHVGEIAFWGIARAKYSLGSDNSLGILYSGRYFAGGKNTVLGADLQYRFLKNAWENNQWVPGQDSFLNMKNGLFFKVSYLWRIR